MPVGSVLSGNQQSDTTIRVECYLPDGGTLTRDESGDLVGYPTDDTDPAYIGPPPIGDEATGRDGGWWVKDKDGAFGVISSVVSGNGIDITLSRAGAEGSTTLMYAVRSHSGAVSDTNEDMPRGVFRSTVALAIPGSATPVYDWLVPQNIKL
ncbi:hypothetical protein P6U16_22210 (plasmid) [Rhizobium sp. 32-5/1]|uniref:hypothetical protein n=1 Tax=Rhizobium sp. 32-5/1 TaxID=3019602 RepID=UPI00240D15DB|nr:hypothetical protein [Rhizobium sp. 32-5/1]WEZ85758.1 hypothetical protein P6U16_22210 [Rhizobium sp. 32-5/1]